LEFSLCPKFLAVRESNGDELRNCPVILARFVQRFALSLAAPSTASACGLWICEIRVEKMRYRRLAGYVAIDSLFIAGSLFLVL
jgi:hypothetical protein